jgi:PEP-CTERM motif
MKKTLICLSLAVASVSAFAQGTVNFGTFTPTYIGAQTNSTTYSSFFGGGSTGNGATGGTALAANGFYYELLWTASGASAPTTLSGLGSWTDSTFYAVNSSGSAGRLIVGNGSSGTAITGMTSDGSHSYSVLLAGWSANLGTSWSSVYTTLTQLANSTYAGPAIVGNAFFGITSVGTTTPTSTSSPGAAVFGTVASGQINSPTTQLFLVPTAVPEPSTMALAGLGGAAMLLFRRRK